MDKIAMKKSVYLLSFSLVTQMVHSNVAFAATPLTIPQAPLSTAAISQVKPNLMFILDSSGSMGRSIYQTGQAGFTVHISWTDTCTSVRIAASFLLISAATLTRFYYNPEIRYQPPVDGAGNEYPSITTYTRVRQNAFDPDSPFVNLLTDLDDFVWCNDNNPSDCLRNNNFLLPSTIGGKRYATQNPVKATGTSKFVSGTPASPVVSAASAVGPYYYRINPGEYCTDDALTDCILASGPSAAYSYPARVRWCDSETNAKARSLRLVLVAPHNLQPTTTFAT
jgi:type IV pilus assembly protein PilY1